VSDKTCANIAVVKYARTKKACNLLEYTELQMSFWPLLRSHVAVGQVKPLTKLSPR